MDAQELRPTDPYVRLTFPSSTESHATRATHEAVERAGDVAVPLGRGVLVDERRSGCGVAKAVHQLSGAGTRRDGERGPGVAQLVHPYRG